ncbi:MAG: hypothetical protein CBE33_05400 [Candidatus Pelagibacter sp. TMED273]|nr:MAG: hypothetical protein CBE33_05400 [Candidatus Pelagibacter sp. TMED273]
MQKKVNIYLFGGNSEIGNAILDGLVLRNKNNEIIIKSFVRSEIRQSISGQIKFVNTYFEATNHIDSNDNEQNIFILSFGVLREENKEVKFIDNLRYHLDINTFEKINILRFLEKNYKHSEVHIVSSILADFIRPSVVSYCLSKMLLDVYLQEINGNYFDKNLFIWKPAFVISNLNRGRNASFLKTNTKKITNSVTSKVKGDAYYIPFYSKYLTILAKRLSTLIRLIDKRNNF